MTKKKVREPSRVYFETKRKCARCGARFTTTHMRPAKDEAELAQWIAEQDTPKHCPFCEFMYGAYLDGRQ